MQLTIGLITLKNMYFIILPECFAHVVYFVFFVCFFVCFCHLYLNLSFIIPNIFVHNRVDNKNEIGYDSLSRTSFGGEQGEAFAPPLILKNRIFCVFCIQNFVFFYFAPLGSRSKFCPRLEKKEMTSLLTVTYLQNLHNYFEHTL